MKEAEKLKRPDWIRVKAPISQGYLGAKKLIDDLKLNAVCEEAACPNIGECWEKNTQLSGSLGQFAQGHVLLTGSDLIGFLNQVVCLFAYCRVFALANFIASSKEIFPFIYQDSIANAVDRQKRNADKLYLY